VRKQLRSSGVAGRVFEVAVGLAGQVLDGEIEGRGAWSAGTRRARARRVALGRSALSREISKRIDLCPARYEEGAISAKRIEGVGKSTVPLPYRGQGALIEREE
jgi:hypothetical protein